MPKREFESFGIAPLDETNIDKAAAAYTAAFSGDPWNEPWTISASKERLTEIRRVPGQISLVLTNDKQEVVALAAGERETWYDGINFYLKELCVDPKFHRMGLGEKLLNAITEEAKKHDVTNIYLNTARNSTAERLYIRNGFSERQEIMMELPRARPANVTADFNHLEDRLTGRPSDGFDLVPLDDTNASSAASIYTKFFNAPPWNENWTEQVAQKRLSEIRSGPGQVCLALVDRENGAVAALAAGSFESWYAGKNFQIKELCIDPKREGEKLEDKILGEILSEADRGGATNIYLYTTKDSPSQRFFADSGFTEREEIVLELPKAAMQRAAISDCRI